MSNLTLSETEVFSILGLTVSRLMGIFQDALFSKFKFCVGIFIKSKYCKDTFTAKPLLKFNIIIIK